MSTVNGRRIGIIGGAGLSAMSAIANVLGSVGLPLIALDEAPVKKTPKPVKVVTDHDRERLRLAEEKRQRKAMKRKGGRD